MNLFLEKLGQQLEGESWGRLDVLEYLVASSPVVLSTCRVGGDYGATFVSEGVRTLWGYEPDEFLGDDSFWADHIHPDDLQRVLDGLRSVLELGHGSHEYRFRAKTGEYRWTYGELRLIRDPAGKPLEIAGHSIDITERKRAETALKESNARLKLAFDGTSDLQALYRVEPGGRFVMETANRAVIERFGVSTGKNLADFLGRSFEEAWAATKLTASEIEELRSHFQTVVQGRARVLFISPQTAVREATEVTLYPVIDQQGVCTYVLSNGRLIGERLRAEAALRESVERFELVIEATHDGIFDRGIASGQYYCSPRYKEILGESDGDELPNDLESFFERIHPDDRSRYRSEFDGYRRDKTLGRFSVEFRLRHKDGTYRWVVSRGRLLRDAEGKLTRIVGAVRDITEHYRAAEKLAAGEKRLRDILDSQFGFVGLYNLDGTVLYINRAPLEAAGIQAED
ncbi:MAG TPA: PAS domain-containing protein, partial [Bryobacteraceae bacterium]|nr:PAS domain-containing protein [Bryobacteraceae bacterium]